MQSKTTIQPNLSIGRELIKSLKWNVIATVGQYIAMIANAVIMARFVSPDQFGIAAIAASSAGLFLVLSQFGFAQAIVGLKTIDKELINTLFTTSLLLAFGLYISLLAVAPFLSRFYNNPMLFSVLTASGVGLFLSLGTSIPTALLQRSLRYRHQSLSRIASAFVTATVGILMAIAGKGVWALVIPALIGQLAKGLIVFRFSGYRPRFAFVWKKLRSSFNFGFSALVSNLSNYICNNAVVFAGGKLWGNMTLGYFTFANSHQRRPFEIIVNQVTPALFPVLCKVAYDISRVRKTALYMIHLGGLSILPLYVVLIQGAPILFPLVFGEQWNQAVLPFQILCVFQMVRTLGFVSNHILYALRLPHISAIIVVIRLIGFAILILSAYLYHLSMISLIILVVFLDIIITLSYLIICLRKIEATFIEYIKVIRLPILIGGLIWLSLSCIMRLSDLMMLAPICGLCIGVVVSILIYLALAYSTLKKVWGRVREVLNVA